MTRTQEKLKLLTAFLLLLTLFAACSKQEQAQPPSDTAGMTAMKEGQGSAIVRAIDTTGKTITLDHNTIPGIMDAMTMQYPVSDAAMLRVANVGDSVTFTLQERGEGNYIVTRVMPKGRVK